VKNTYALARSATMATEVPPPSEEADETLPTIEGQGEPNPSEPAVEAPAEPADSQPAVASDDGQPLPAAEAALPGEPAGPPTLDDSPPPPEPKATPAPKPNNRRLKLALIGVAVLLVLSATGGLAYVLTRPKPLISVTSDYQLGRVPAGAASTALHVAGRQFSSNSAITFLLDGEPAPGSQIVPSDQNGAFEADLTITAKWKPGSHQLTARDATGATTQAGVRVMIVQPGEAHTPGPNGSPANDTPLFTLHITVDAQSTASQSGNPTGFLPTYRFAFLGSGSLVDIPTILTVHGQPDPAGGAVCNLPNDDGQAHISDFTFTLVQGLDNSIGPVITIHTSLTRTCTGTYKGGKISYTETITSYQESSSNGPTCTLPTPTIAQQLQGAINSATTASGTYSAPALTATCSDGTTDTVSDAETGTWTAILSS
jgi:hypothetical protein